MSFHFLRFPHCRAKAPKDVQLGGINARLILRMPLHGKRGVCAIVAFFTSAEIRSPAFG
jgi:hypothetical protein